MEGTIQSRWTRWEVNYFFIDRCIRVLNRSDSGDQDTDSEHRVIGQCQSAIAEALNAFEKIDVLVLCQSEALVGSIEELSQSYRAQSLVRDQFETNFFAPVNLIKSVLPSMRANRDGHLIAVTGISKTYFLQ